MSIPIQWRYEAEYEISDMIAERNTSNAYIIREGKFNIMFREDDNIWQVIERFGRWLRF